jgi:hypothetical protein
MIELKNILTVILFTSIWVIGIMIVTNKGMILEKLGEWGNKKVDQGHKIFEAIIACPWCMPSIHSSVGFGFYFLFFGIQWDLLLSYPIVAMGSSFCSGFTWTVYNFIVKVNEYYVHKEQMACWDIKDRKKLYNKNKNYGKGKKNDECEIVK